MSRPALHLCATVVLLATGCQRAPPQIKSDERVAFYGPYVHWRADGEPRLVLEGRIFEPESRSIVRAAAIDKLIAPQLLKHLGKKPEDLDDAQRKLLYSRLAAFINDGESGKSLRLRVRGAADEAVAELPETDAGGYFSFAGTRIGKTPLADLIDPSAKLELEAVLPANDEREFRSVVLVPPRQLPLLVVSDIDDTIRIAEVTQVPRLLERTLLLLYEAVPGIAATYRELAEHGARFHYVSGSPWQLTGVIEQFAAEARFPPAVLHCRKIGWDFWNNDPLDTRTWKVAEIRKLLGQFPACPVLLVGDSGEQDPEVYEEICRDHPDRVVGVWIRVVNDTWDARRIADAAKLVGEEHVAAFRDAAELTPRVQVLILRVRATGGK